MKKFILFLSLIAFFSCKKSGTTTNLEGKKIPPGLSGKWFLNSERRYYVSDGFSNSVYHYYIGDNFFEFSDKNFSKDSWHYNPTLYLTIDGKTDTIGMTFFNDTTFQTFDWTGYRDNKPDYYYTNPFYMATIIVRQLTNDKLILYTKQSNINMYYSNPSFIIDTLHK